MKIAGLPKRSDRRKVNFADVKNDIAFRKIFGNEKNTQILIRCTEEGMPPEIIVDMPLAEAGRIIEKLKARKKGEK